MGENVVLPSESGIQFTLFFLSKDLLSSSQVNKKEIHKQCSRPHHYKFANVSHYYLLRDLGKQPGIYYCFYQFSLSSPSCLRHSSTATIDLFLHILGGNPKKELGIHPLNCLHFILIAL